MSDLTRRAFLHAVGGAGVAIGVGAALGGLPGATAAPDARAADPPESGPVVARLRDLPSGAVTFYVGTREVTVHDRELALRLARAAAATHGSTSPSC
jgi:hypothetical protein